MQVMTLEQAQVRRDPFSRGEEDEVTWGNRRCGDLGHVTVSHDAALVVAIWRSAWALRSARDSCAVPITALTATITPMKAALDHSRKAIDRPAATSRM